MIDLRKVLIIFVISVLFSAFVLSSIEAVYPEPKYEDYCTSYNYGPRPMMPVVKENFTCPETANQQLFESCTKQKGYVDYKIYDSNGCPKEPFCNMCSAELDHSKQKYNFVYFLITALFGLIAIALGVYLPTSKNALHEWIGTGFMLGGLFVLFFGTIKTFTDLNRYVRPLILLFELLVIIWLSYKKLGKEK